LSGLLNAKEYDGLVI